MVIALMNIGHERLHPRTLKEDANIESFNSMLERGAIRRFEFESFRDAEAIIGGSVEFYNKRRLHSSIGYTIPEEAYEKWKVKCFENA